WQRLFGDLLDRLDSLPGAVARSGSALNDGARIEVKTGDFVQALLLRNGHERGVGDHLPLVVLDEQIVQVLGHAPELRPRLDVDLVELVEENEALLVSAADEDVEVIQRRLD